MAILTAMATRTGTDIPMGMATDIHMAHTVRMVKARTGIAVPHALATAVANSPFLILSCA